MENLDFRFSGSAKAVKIAALTFRNHFYEKAKLSVTALSLLKRKKGSCKNTIFQTNLLIVTKRQLFRAVSTPKSIESKLNVFFQKMKAMKKFKVIEESRFLHKQDMQILAGGACAPVTSTWRGCRTWRHCISGMIYNTCIGVAPYDSWMCGIRIYYHCDSTRTFDHRLVVVRHSIR